MNLIQVITAVCSLFFLLIGVDKFFPFMEASCSLIDSIPPAIWKFLGVLELAASILIWWPKFRKYVAGFFFVFMLTFIVVHLMADTYDIGGAAFMAVLLGILLWTPRFLGGKGK